MNSNGCCQSGCTHIDDIVSDQNSGKESMGIVFHPFDQGVRLVFIFGQMPGFCSTYGKKGSFRRGKKAGQNKQNNQYNNLVYHDTCGSSKILKNKRLNPFFKVCLLKISVKNGLLIYLAKKNGACNMKLTL